MIAAFAAELVGTFFLVFLGCGSVVLTEAGHLYGWVPPLVFGATVGGMIALLRDFSGAHFNPAVSLGFLAIKRLTPSKEALFLVAQLLGAFLGCVALYLLFGGTQSYGAASPTTDPAIILYTEGAGTFILMFVIVFSSDPQFPRPTAPLAIGGTVALISDMGGSYNPARAVMPALFSGSTTGLSLRIIISVLGALAGAFAASRH